MPQIKFHAVGAHEGKTITLDRFDFVEGVYTFTGSPQDAEIITKVLREQYSAVPESEFEEARKAFEDAQAEAALAEPETSPASLEMSIKQRVTARRFIDEGLDPDHVYGPGEASRVIKAHIAQLRLEDAEGDDVLTAEELTELKTKQEAEEKAKREAEEKAKAEQEAKDKAEKERLEKEAADKATAEAAEKAKAEQEAKEKAEKDAADKAAADALLQQNGGQQAPVDPEKPEGEQHQENPSQDNGGGEQQPEGAKIETVADALQALDPSTDEHWTSRGVPSIEAMTKLLGRQVTRAEIEEVAPDYTRAVAKAAKASS
jgi:Mg-chelatase subunit ChlI